MLDSLHQESHVTGLNRYPLLYSGALAVANALYGSSHVSILVLGCSTGEEPYTLATQYFARASHRIHATDICASVVDIASTRYPHPRISYSSVGAPRIPWQSACNIVFANSVFCRWPASRGVESIAEFYPFSVFETALAEIDQQLVMGGLLALYNANYRLSDTSLAHRYVPLRLPGLEESGFVTKFDPDGQVSADQAYPYALFLKVADPAVVLAAS